MTDTAAADAAELLEALSVAAAEADPHFDEASKLAALGLDKDGRSKFKPDSMVRFNGQPLPARTKVYRADNGMEVWVPTAQLAHILRKEKADAPGVRAFVAKKPEGVEPKYISDTCEICFERNVEKKFRSARALRNHMRAFHSDEYEEEREEKGFLSNLARMSDQEKAAVRALLNEKGGK